MTEQSILVAGGYGVVGKRIAAALATDYPVIVAGRHLEQARATSLGTTLDSELRRYDVVIHLRTPSPEHAYNHQNPLRTESPATAAEIDARIAQAWASHSRRFIVESSSDFLDKAARALRILRGELPGCCQRHVIPALRNHLTKPVGPDVGQPRTE